MNSTQSSITQTPQQPLTSQQTQVQPQTANSQVQTPPQQQESAHKVTLAPLVHLTHASQTQGTLVPPAQATSAPQTQQTTPALGVAQNAAANQAPPPFSFGGLGGTPISSSAGQTSFGSSFSAGVKNEGQSLRESALPQELLLLTEELKTQIKNNKLELTELGRANDKDIQQISLDIEEVRVKMSNVHNLIHRQVLLSNTLIKDFNKEFKFADTALVSKDPTNHLVHESTSQSSYEYLCLVMTNFKDKMVHYRREIERCEKAINSIMDSNSVNAKDLWTALNSTKNAVISLAAKTQTLHEQVNSEITVNENMRKVLGGDHLGPLNLRGNEKDDILNSNHLSDDMKSKFDAAAIFFNTRAPTVPGPVNTAPMSFSGEFSSPFSAGNLRPTAPITQNFQAPTTPFQNQTNISIFSPTSHSTPFTGSSCLKRAKN